MSQTDVYRMIGRRARDAGIATRIGCHSFRATGITEYLRNGGKLEVAVICCIWITRVRSCGARQSLARRLPIRHFD
jgi:integrase